jgi:ADP-ribosylglycohydrolase
MGKGPDYSLLVWSERAHIQVAYTKFKRVAGHKAVSIGGDSDTIACIAGDIAHAFYRKVSRTVEEMVMAIPDERHGRVAREFKAKNLQE